MHRVIKVGRVYQWLDQGPAIILASCDVEGESIAVDEADDVAPTYEKGWVISLLQTGEFYSKKVKVFFKKIQISCMARRQ